MKNRALFFSSGIVSALFIFACEAEFHFRFESRPIQNQEDAGQATDASVQACTGTYSVPEPISTLSRSEIESILVRRAPKMDPSLRRAIARTIQRESARRRVDPLLVLAVMRVESAYDPVAVSPAGAIGLMQVMPATFVQVMPVEESIVDPVANVRAGIRYLGLLQSIFGDREHVLMAYNAGPRYVKYHLERSGRVPRPVFEYSEQVRREHEKLLRNNAF